MASAKFTIDGVVPTAPVSTTASASHSLALVSTSGVRSVVWSVAGSHAAGATEPTITPTGSPAGVTATLTMPSGTWQSFLIQCVVNGGRDVNGNVDGNLTAREIIGVPVLAGIVPFAVGEELERNATHGVTEDLNNMLAGNGTPVDHGTLLGLSGDDHPDYYPADGSRPITGALNANGEDIGTSGTPAGDGYFSGNIAVGGTVDGVDVAAHAAAAAPHTGVYALDGSRALTAALNANGQDIGTSGTPAGITYTSTIATPISAYKVIAAGAFTATGGFHTIDTEGGASLDDLATINGGTDGMLLELRLASAARKVRLVETGNIIIPVVTSLTLSGSDEHALLRYDMASAKWIVLNPMRSSYLRDGSEALTAALNANGQDIGSSGTPAGTVYTSLIAMQAAAQIDLVTTSISDDTAIEISSVGQGLIHFFTNDLSNPAGTLFYRSTTSPSVHLIEICGCANQQLLNVVTGDTILDGTTGANGFLNVAVGGSSMFFENRRGVTLLLSYLRITS